MREDQKERLRALTEKLADVVLSDADPDGWVGKDKLPSELTQQERGDAYWCRKMALASIGVLNRTEALIASIDGKKDGDDPLSDANLDQEVKAAEKEADAILKRLQTGKKEFDRRVHGKP
jgi:hypothetical protein